MAHILAYDLGTGGVKAALYSEDGELVAAYIEGYPTFHPVSGQHEQSPILWWQATVKATHALINEAGREVAADIRAIGVSGHSLGVVPLDDKGELLLDRVPIWSDARAGAQAESVFAKIPEAEWYMITGNGFPAALYPVFKLMWLRQHQPDVFWRIATVIGTKDYINLRLTGSIATDYSYASGCGAYNLSSREYSGEIFGAADIDLSLFPQPMPSTGLVGELTTGAAEELGLPVGIKVVAGGVDNSCMTLGAGVYRDGEAYNSLGSSSWIAVSGSKPVLDVGSRPYVFEHVVPGQYVSALAIFAAGSALSWGRDVLCCDLSALAGDGGSVYRLMDNEAMASPPGANGVIFNPSLAGGTLLDNTPHLRGGFVNLELRHTRADMLRAVYEGVALGLRQVLDGLSCHTTIKSPLKVVGGGAKSEFWCQMFADVFDRPIATHSAGQQAAALGAATLAAVGAGVWDGFERLETIIMSNSEYLPDLNSVIFYQQLLIKYQNVSEKLGMLAEYWEESVGGSLR